MTCQSCIWNLEWLDRLIRVQMILGNDFIGLLNTFRGSGCERKYPVSPLDGNLTQLAYRRGSLLGMPDLLYQRDC
jgi:hypothetical protein